jgi:uncharacterized protein
MGMEKVAGDAKHTGTPEVFGNPITTIERLREILPPPYKVTTEKIQYRFDHHCRTYISLTPWVMVATADAEGNCDASPRGGPPGFIKIVDNTHLIIPEVIGNRAADTLQNLLVNPHVGLMFVIPGLEETLRLNGRAYIVQDPDVLGSAIVKDKRPQLGIGVEVDEIYVHCAKAAKRGSLWNPAGWPDRSSLASMAQIIRDHSKGAVGDGSVEAVQQLLDESYTKRLY